MKSRCASFNTRGSDPLHSQFNCKKLYNIYSGMHTLTCSKERHTSQSKQVTKPLAAFSIFFSKSESTSPSCIAFLSIWRFTPAPEPAPSEEWLDRFCDYRLALAAQQWRGLASSCSSICLSWGRRKPGRWSQRWVGRSRASRSWWSSHGRCGGQCRRSRSPWFRLRFRRASGRNTISSSP